MKATFAPPSGSRALLLDGCIVLELFGEPVAENRSFDELVDLQDACTIRSPFARPSLLFCSESPVLRYQQALAASTSRWI